MSSNAQRAAAPQSPASSVELDRASFFGHDWQATVLGPREAWPRQLHFLSDLLLCSEQPMFLLWGSQRAFIFNQAYLSLWKAGSAANLGRPIKDVVGDNWPRLRRMVERVFAGTSFVESNYAIHDPVEERLRHFDFSYTPVRPFGDEKEPVIAALCIATDVTEQVESVEAMRQEREILALTVENVAEGIALIEQDFSLVLWNEPFRQHFGYAPGQIRQGMNAAELMHESACRGDLGPGDPGAIVAQLVGGIQHTESGSLQMQRADGTVLKLLRRSLSRGRHLLVSQDVTDEWKAARLKDELVSTVSHELRTPLAAISGALGIIGAGAAGELSEKTERLVAIAQRNSERLIALVNDLLDADKLQSGKVEFRLETLDLAELVCSAVEQNQHYGGSANVTLQADCLPRPVFVTGDRNRLLQVLANLISNAVKFSFEGGKVIVRVRQDGATARLSVVDQGMGVAEQFRPRLFQRFSQHDGSTSRAQQGTGLGLAITQSIVEQLGGTVRFEPTQPQGATFHVELPVAPPDDAAQGAYRGVRP